MQARTVHLEDIVVIRIHGGSDFFCIFNAQVTLQAPRASIPLPSGMLPSGKSEHSSDADRSSRAGAGAGGGAITTAMISSTGTESSEPSASASASERSEGTGAMIMMPPMAQAIHTELLLMSSDSCDNSPSKTTYTL